MDRRAIEALIPHRAPFLWIDEILELEPGVRCVARKVVDPREPFFTGHFPNNAIVPGVLLIEAVAQTAGVMLASAAPIASGATPMLAAVNRFKFLKPVAPGSSLRVETRKLTEVGSMALVEGSVSVLDEVVAKGELSVAG
jgi:3-hydroxyacyl-[acyl-carrier-protein] dehydratase